MKAKTEKSTPHDGQRSAASACSPPLTKEDVGKLKSGMRVKAQGKLGTITSVHEPTWFNYRTQSFERMLQSCDVRLDEEQPYNTGIIPSRSFHFSKLVLLENDRDQPPMTGAGNR